MKITVKRAGGDPTLGHIADLDVKHINMSYGGTSIMSHSEYRWLCSCGCPPGEWAWDAQVAVKAGDRHVRAMGRR